MKIGGATLNQIPMDWDNNINNILTAIRNARHEGVELLCLPELCITGYGCEDMFLSKWLPEKSLQLLPPIIEACEDITVSVGLPIIYEHIVYNCTCLIKDQEILGFNVKQLLPYEGVHYEPRWFTPWKPGRLEEILFENRKYPFGDLIHDINGVKVGFEICEDAWREKERPACRLVERGIDLILNPSASHFAFEKVTVREDIAINSSKRFDCVFLHTNMLGNEAGRMVYDGDVVIAQKGMLLERNPRLSYQSVNLAFTDVDFDEPAVQQPSLRDDVRDRNTEFAKAASLALFDYLRKSRSKGFVLSLSGGADSSCCAILVAEMVRRGLRELGTETFLIKLGREDIIDLVKNESNPDEVAKIITNGILTCAYQATKNSSDDTYESAKALADSIGAIFYSWHIDEQVTAYTKEIEAQLQRSLEWETDDIALQNIQARARSPIIWMLANIKQSLLITTSNRSEGDVGYATMDGDTSGSIAPIAAVDKHFIKEWLVWAQAELGYTALDHVNNLRPSAELRPLEQTQTDEDDLMPYAVLVEIEKLAIRDKKSPVEVYKVLSKIGLENSDELKSYISKFFRLWARNQWKRERTAPAFHLDDFNIDPRTWCRFPILSGSFKEELEELNRL